VDTSILTYASNFRAFSAETLSSLIKIPSFSGQEGDVCGRLVTLCNEAGFDDVRIDGFGNVIATIGSGPRAIAFDAHMDTVGVGDPSHWDLDPFSGLIKDNLVFGRGAANQKGGAAAMITAGKILKDSGYEGEFTIYLTFTVLEEDCDGLCWMHLIEREGLRPDFAVSTEPTSCRLYRGHRGRMEIEVAIQGLSAHGSAPERGESAAYKAARAALAIERLNADLPSDEFLGKGTVVVSKIDARGPSLCSVPDTGMLYLDRRLTLGESSETAVSQVKDYLAEESNYVKIPTFDRKSWTGSQFIQELYFPTWQIPEQHPLVQAGKSTCKALFGTGPDIGKWTFSTNCVAICGRHNIPCIGYGPGDEDKAHAPNEYTRIDDLEKCSAFYALLPLELEKSLHRDPDDG
jgi:putative selenium metabolism hydrolase